MSEATVNYLGCFPQHCVEARCRAPCCFESVGCFCALVFRGQMLAVGLCLPHGRAADSRIRGLLGGKSQAKAVCLLGLVTRESRTAGRITKRFSEYGDPVPPRGRYLGYRGSYQ